MLEKMIGVSPPQNVGQAKESKALSPHDLKDTAGVNTAKEAQTAAQSRYKNDFEHALKQKMAQQKKSLDKKNEETSRNDQLAAKNKKSSGGIKKKMTEEDDKIVSNNMASQESVKETPSLKIEELAEININPETLNSIGKAEASEQKEVIIDALSLKPEGLEPQVMENAKAASSATAAVEPSTTLNAVEQQLGQEVQYQSEMTNTETKPQVELSAAQLNKKAGEAFKLETSEKTAEATDAFEKNILSQLKRDESFNSNTNGDAQQGDGYDPQDKSDLKSDLVGQELHQAAGQSHSSFKTHVEAAELKRADLSSQLESNREANINEVMNQAQYLVKKGGGEVTVKMSPEGLGEVQLKVQLMNGQLSIEMQTHDKEVKKLIEDSLSELKSGLAAQRISLEHVKINTVDATNADNTAQMQSNLNHGGQGGSNRDFMSDVQQQMNQNQQQQSQQRNSQSRAGLTEVNAPLSLSQASQAKGLRTYGGTKGATINRVA